ncbi:MAG: DUF4333 domain-containing protein [Acidimicrobiales bacterium]
MRASPTGSALRGAGGALAALAAVAAAAGMLSGCGVHHTVDVHSVQSRIADQLAGQYSVPAPKVTCTSPIPLTPGQAFSCSTILDGQPLQLQGTITDDKGHFTVNPAEAVIVVSHAETQLQGDISAQAHTPTTLDCGTKTLLVVAPGHSFSCTAHLQGQGTRPVTVTVVNLKGDVRYTLAPPAS